MTDDRKQVYQMIEAEWIRAKGKHGDASIDGQMHSNGVRLAVLLEELGEVARSILDTGEPDEAELTQLASASVAWLAMLLKMKRQREPTQPVVTEKSAYSRCGFAYRDGICQGCGALEHEHAR